MCLLLTVTVGLQGLDQRFPLVIACVVGAVFIVKKSDMRPLASRAVRVANVSRLLPLSVRC